MSLRAGVIGCGQLGRIHTEALLEIGRMKMTAFCDVVQEKAESYAAKYGGDYAVNDPGRIFADDRIDAVYICTQHDSHAQFCIQALDAGKHVMVEKPLALTVAECLAINAAVNRSKAKLMTAFKMRYFELIAKAKALIPHPLLVTMQMMDNRWPTGSWVNDPIKGGGNVLSQGCHSCDILRFVAGSDPVEVYAAGGNYYQESGVVDNLAATFRMENGTACSWVQGDCNCPSPVSKFFLQLFAEGKSVTLSNRLCTLTYNEPGKEPQVFKGTETGFLEENRAFVAAIEQDVQAPIDHTDGLLATLMVLQAFASTKSGRPEPISELLGTQEHRGVG